MQPPVQPPGQPPVQPPVQVAVYGGSFNPPHIGHAMVVAWLLWTGTVQRVWLVPVFHHAFEGQQDKRLAPFEARLRWCRLLVEDIGAADRIDVLDLEARLPRPSYTIDTLRALALERPGHRLRLVIGTDVLPQLPRWRAWDEIEAGFAPIIVGRQGHAPSPSSLAFPDVSSSEIRRALREGRPVEHLLTRRVAWDLRQGAPAALWPDQGAMA